MCALNLTVMESKALKVLRDEISIEWPGAELTIFGSRASGLVHPESDLDILIKLPGPITAALRRRLVHRIFDLNLEFGTNVSMLLVSREEWENTPLSITPIHRVIEAEGIPF